MDRDNGPNLGKTQQPISTDIPARLAHSITQRSCISLHKLAHSIIQPSCISLHKLALIVIQHSCISLQQLAHTIIQRSKLTIYNILRIYQTLEKSIQWFNTNMEMSTGTCYLNHLQVTIIEDIILQIRHLLRWHTFAPSNPYQTSWYSDLVEHNVIFRSKTIHRVLTNI